MLCKDMAIRIPSLLRFMRVLVHPIFPASPDEAPDRKVTFLIFLHILSGLFVFLTVCAAEEDQYDNQGIGTWTIVMVFVIFGLISLFFLIVQGCQNKLKAPREIITRMPDPSLNLRILFLWIFGLVVIIHVSVNLAIEIQCMETFQVRTVRGVISALICIMLIIFLLLQISFITYYRNSSFVQNTIVNMASIVVFIANFVVWFNSVVSSIHEFEKEANVTNPRQSNESFCSRTYSIQVKLGKKLRHFLLPVRLEFCILASSFIISFWIWPIAHHQENLINRGEVLETDSTGRRHRAIGPHIFATVFGIILNAPIFLSQLLLDFVFNNKQENVFFAMHLGECISALCGIISIYISSYHLIRRFDNRWRPAGLTTNEYILILSSSAMVAYFVFGFLIALSRPVPVYMLLINCIIALLETFLQTHYLLKLKRYNTEGKTSVLISSTGIFFMIKNLIFWFVYSYNAYRHSTKLDLVLVDTASWPYMRQVLESLKTFYRFFSGMIAYSVYCKFRPFQ